MGWLAGLENVLWPNRHIRRYAAKCIGPRMVGGEYWCGYWRETYTVTDLTVTPDGAWSILVRWHGDAQCANPQPARDGQWHSTPWDMERDRIIRQPDEPPEVCGASITFGGADPSGSECDLDPNHEAAYHEGPDPFGGSEYARVRWTGGGSCAGDSLPVRDVEFFVKED